MRKFKIILLLICGALIVCAVLLAVFSDSIARNILVWTLESVTGNKVRIEGPVEFDLSMEPSLSVADMRIKPKKDDGKGLTAHLGNIRTKIALKQLVSGIVLIRDLSVVNATISFVDENGVMPASRDDEKSLREKLADIHIPVVENLSLENINVDYRDNDTGYTLDVLINSLNVADVRDEGPLFVKGNGTVNETPFSVNGRIGSVADVLRHAIPYPLDIKLTVSDFRFSISGIIDDPVHGRGMNLRIISDEEELSRIMRVLKIEVTHLGHLAIDARIIGDVAEPGISDLSIKVSGRPGIEFSAGGSITNLITGEGTDVVFTGSCSNIDLIRMALPGKLHDMDEFALRGRLRSRGEFTVEDLMLTVRKKKESAITVTGGVNLGANLFDPAGFRADLRFRMDAARSAPLRSILFDWLPDIGPVTAEARVTGHLNDLSLEDINVTAGVPTGAMIIARGRIGSLPRAHGAAVSGIDITLSIRSEKAERLFANVKAKIPEFKSLSADFRIHGAGDRLVFEDIVARTTDSEGVKGRASGNFILEARKDGTFAGIFDLNINISAPQLSNFTKLLAARTLPKLGPVKFFTHLTGTTDIVSLEDIFMEAGQEGNVHFAWQGRIGRVPLSGHEPVSEVELASTFYCKQTSLLSTYVGFSVPDLGHVESSSHIISRPGGYGADDIVVVVGNSEDHRLKATGSIEYIMRGTDVAFEGMDLSVSIRQLDSALLLASFGYKKDLGRISGNISVSGDLSDFALSHVRLSAVSQGNVSVSAQGAVHHIKIRGEKHVQGITADVSAQGPDMNPVKEITGIDLPDLGPFNLHVKVNDRAKDITIEKIHLLTGDKEKPTLLLDGQMHHVLSSDEMDFSGSFEAAVRPWSMKFFGHELPQEQQVKGRIELTGTIDQFSIKGSAQLGETLIQADVERYVKEGQPRIDVNVTSPRVYAKDIGLHDVATDENDIQSEGSPSPSEKRIFGEALLPFDKLNAMDIALGVNVDEVVEKNFNLHDLALNLTIEDGLLVLRRAGIKYTNGFISVESTIDMRSERPRLALKVNAKDIDSARLFSYLHFPWISSGHLNIAADLRSSGRSPREIASALQGDLGLALENGRIQRIVDYLGADAIDFVTTVHKAQKYQQLNCLAMKFHFEDGIGTSDIIYSDTPEVRSQGKGTINLRDETIDIVIQPKPKKGQIGGSSAVTLSGSLKRPSVKKLPFIEAARLFGEIFMPYAFLPARAAGYVWYLMKNDSDEESPCLRAE